MESCSFVRQGIGRCGSKFNCKEVEFRHPNYKDLNERVYVCQIHFMEVFGQSVAVKDSVKPLEEEAWLLVQLKNEDSRYRTKLAQTRKQVKDGIGTDYFDWGSFDASNKRTLDDLKAKLKILRRSQCRFEWCKKRITDWRNIYIVRVYPRNPTDYVNLVFCCLDHWEIYKKRIGLVGLKGSLDETRVKPSQTLDAFVVQQEVADI
jgi:hypothetical protein